MAGAVQHVHARLDGLWELGVRLHGFRDEVVVVDARMVVACPGHRSAHAAVQVDHPDRHLHTVTWGRVTVREAMATHDARPEKGTSLGRLCAVALHSRCSEVALPPACKP